MFKEKNLSKLIFITPIIFIILTSSLITFIHINKANNKFKEDSRKLKDEILKKEKQKLKSTLDSINSYIVFKKSNSVNIVKQNIKSRVDFAHKLLTNIYNTNIGIESKNSIQASLLENLNKAKNSDDLGSYFIYEYEKITQNNSKEINKSFISQFKSLLNSKNKGFITYFEEFKENNQIKKEIKVSYIKVFEDLQIVLGYSSFLNKIKIDTKNEVLNRLDLMKIPYEGSTFVLDNSFKILQHSKNKIVVGKNYKDFINKAFYKQLSDYLRLSQLQLENENYKYIWHKVNSDNYKLLVFNYIEQWDWLMSLSMDIKNIDSQVSNVLGSIEKQRNESIKESILIAVLFMVFASIISFFISKLINDLLSNYKRRIEAQNKELAIINQTLEQKVDKKTAQLRVLNEKLQDKFKIEIQKSRKKDQILYNQSKAASMGEMIGNIAHQWRQPLSVISTIASGNSFKLEYDNMTKQELINDFTEIVDTTKHLSTTIEDFRNFFIEDKNIESFDIVKVIEKALSLIKASMRNNYIVINKDLESIQITGIKNELLQGVLNILNNSRDILVTKDESQRVIDIKTYTQGNKAYISITDSGQGIEDAIINKIFDPYFTTKDKSSGTGIGLYMTKEMIESHMNGKLEVINKEFNYNDKTYYGACFTISFNF